MVDIEAAVHQWRRDGWVLIEDLVDGATMDLVADELVAMDVPEPVGPTRRSDAPSRRADTPTGRADTDDQPRFRSAQFDGTTLFPLPGSPTLNRLVVDPGLVRFARQAIGETDLRLYQSRLWSKHGDHTDYEQPLHRDLNHSLVPARNEPGWWHLECFLYLSDVDAENGAPRLVPHPAIDASGVERPSGRVSADPDQYPELYRMEVSAAGPRGSLLAYRSDVWHRGLDLAPGRERHVLVVAYRPAAADWIGFDAHPPLVDNLDFKAFVEASTPDELALFGIPRPGHHFWTPATVEAMAEIYPGLDLAPWRSAQPAG